MEILNQEKFFEKLIEIILLKCLNSECIMENTENSKDFIKQFKIDWTIKQRSFRNKINNQSSLYLLI
mgnify:CR=1 FL=1